MDSLSKSLEETIKSKNLTTIEDQIEEIVIETSDNILDDAQKVVVSEVPIIKTIFTVSKVIRGISTYLLAKKIARFLTQLDTIKQEERVKFFKEMKSVKRKEILENLLMILDRIEHLQKAEILGRLFRNFITNEINKEEFDALTYATSMIDVALVPDVIKYYTSAQTYDNSVMYHFLFLGLVELDSSKIGTWGGGGITFGESSLGKKFAHILTS